MHEHDSLLIIVKKPSIESIKITSFSLVSTFKSYSTTFPIEMKLARELRLTQFLGEISIESFSEEIRKSNENRAAQHFNCFSLGNQKIRRQSQTSKAQIPDSERMETTAKV